MTRILIILRRKYQTGIRLLILGGVVLSGSVRLSRAAAVIDTNRVTAIAALLPEKPVGFGRPINDRAAWEKLAALPSLANEISRAEKLANSPDPALPDDLYLDYSRTGNRDRGQRVIFDRSIRLATFAMAECLENKGRFLAPLSNTIVAICAEKTWVYPAHDSKLDNFYGRSIDIDLCASTLASDLATADYLLGEKFSPDLRKLLRDNIYRRVLTPFSNMAEGRRKEIHWMRIKNNWNAVCLAGVTVAALSIEESATNRARFIAESEFYIANFLQGFPADGYCSEGLGYWNYGFGHFIMLTEAIRQNTGGAIDLLTNQSSWLPARFSARDEILKNIYPTISDCPPSAKPDLRFVRYVNERFGLPVNGDRVKIFSAPENFLTEMALYPFLPEKLPPLAGNSNVNDSPLRTWFSAGGVLICRDAPIDQAKFGVALKGGNNAENHNHNDVGSFSVVSGGKMLICDPGAEVYTSRTFGPHRYDSKVLNSFGHAVPIIAGNLQSAGAAAHAEIVRENFSAEQDSITMDYRSAYPVPSLNKLERTFTFHRNPSSLTVRDDVEFASPQTFESALITWGKWKQISPDEITIRDGDTSVRVKINTGGAAFMLKAETIDEDVHSAIKPVHLGIVLKSPVKKTSVTFVITPEGS